MAILFVFVSICAMACLLICKVFKFTQLNYLLKFTFSATKWIYFIIYLC